MNKNVWFFRTDYFVVLITCATAMTTQLPQQQTIQRVKISATICLISLIVFQTKTALTNLPIRNYGKQLLLLNGVIGDEGKPPQWLTTTAAKVGLTSTSLLSTTLVVLTTIIVLITKKTGGGGKLGGGKEKGLMTRVVYGTKFAVSAMKNILTVMIILSVIMTLIVIMKTIILIRIMIIIITTKIELL